MTRSLSRSSMATSENETEKSFSDTEAFVHRGEGVNNQVGGGGEESGSESEDGWELDYIEDARITIDEETDRVQRFYKLKFKGYDQSEWQPENNVDALQLVRCFWENIYTSGPGTSSADQLQACIQAQQQLLIEIENRPDSDSDSDQEQQQQHHGKNTTCSNITNTSFHNNHSKNQKQNKKFKQLKPRRAADSDVAETDSDSADEGSDQEQPITYSIPSIFSDDHQTYKPTTSKMRKQIKNELELGMTSRDIHSDPASSLSSLLGGIDLNPLYNYKPRDPAIGKQMERLMGEIRPKEIPVLIQAHEKKPTGRKLRVIWKQETQNDSKKVTDVRDSEGGDNIPIPETNNIGRESDKENEGRLRSNERHQSTLIKKSSRDRNKEKMIRSAEKRREDIPQSQSKSQVQSQTRSVNSYENNGPLTEMSSNQYHLRLSNRNMTKNKRSSPPNTVLSPSHLMTVGSSSSLSPQPTASDGDRDRDPDDDDIDNILYLNNPRIKRKHTDFNNMKHVTYNQFKKKCRKLTRFNLPDLS